MVYTQRKTTRVFLPVLVFTFAALFVFSLANSASADVFTLTGKIVALDRDAKTLTVDPGTYYEGRPAMSGATGIRSFALEHNAWVMMGNEKRDFRDLHIGDWVTVSFHEEGSGLVKADGIALASPPEPYVASRQDMYSLTGKVVSIDRDGRTLSIDPGYYYGPNYKGERTFAFDRGAWVMMGSDKRELKDLRVGDWVTVTFYRGNNGLLTAEGIVITSPPAPFFEERAQVMPVHPVAQNFSLTGKIVAIDREAKSIKVDPSYYYGPNYNGIRTARAFSFAPGMSVMLGSERKTFNDLNLGDLVTVTFHQDSNGLIVPDDIAITSPATMMCPEIRG